MNVKEKNILIEKKKFIISAFRTFFNKETKNIKDIFEKIKKENNKKTKDYKFLESLVGKQNSWTETFYGIAHYISNSFLAEPLPSHNFLFKRGETSTLMKWLSFSILVGRKEEIQALEREIIGFLQENKTKDIISFEELEKKEEYYY